MELNDVLNDEPPKEEVPQQEKVEAPEGVAPRGENQQRARNKEREAQEAGKTKAEVKAEDPPKVEPPKSEVKPPEQELTAKERAAFAAAADERGKRQALERRVAEMEAAQKAAPKEPEKPFWDDPEGKLKTFEERQAAFRAEMQHTLASGRLETSEMIARSKYPDFEEKAQAFAQIVQQTPGLWQQAQASGNAAEFAYRVGKNHLDLQAAGSIDQLKAQIEKETRIKVEQEMKEKQEAARRERSSIPPSLSQARGTSQNRPVWDGPPPLDNILND